MRPTPRWIRLLAPVLLLATAACDLPRYEGPQVQSPPPGFTLNPGTSPDEPIFPDRPIVYQDAWIRFDFGEFSGIYITGFPGSTSMDQVEAARQHALSLRANRPDQILVFGPVESLTIDGRDAMGWPEMIRSETRGLEAVAYRAVVPYDTISYTVEFLSLDPSFKSRPDSLKAIVSSFEIGRVRINYPLILIIAGVVVFLVSRTRARSKDRQLRHASMSLPKIERSDPDDGGGEGPAAPGRPSSKPGSAAPPSPERPTRPSPPKPPPGPADPS